MPRQYELLSLFGPGSIRTWIVPSAAGEMPETVATCVLLLRQSNAAEDVVARFEAGEWLDRQNIAVEPVLFPGIGTRT